MSAFFRSLLRSHLWLLLLAALSVHSFGMAKKKLETTVRFFTEANEQDTERFAEPLILHNPPRQAFISRIPDISERDVVAIYPFQAADGTWGCAFKLDEHGKIALNTLSVERRGTSIVAFVNIRQVIDMKIDRIINDGIIVIQFGLTPEEVDLLKKRFRVLGETGKKKK
ncbi:MAG: hypothetical protein QM796_18070 [Chthoniobacteraceae bacterium]